MAEESESKALLQIAASGALEGASWPSLRDDILRRLDKIAHTVFPIPKLPRLQDSMFGHASPSSSMQAHEETSSATLDIEEDEQRKEEEVAKENQKDVVINTSNTILPQQIVDQLDAIKAQLRHFSANPPHTVQRLAELLLNPLAHYRALASYLHAVDRVVNVTSGTNVYPLPLPLVPDLSAGREVNSGDNGEEGGKNQQQQQQQNPAAAVSWSNSTSSAPAPALGSDEALGGALLTPVPWLTTTATATATSMDAAASSSPSSSTTSPPSSTSTAATTGGTKTAAGARIHSEGTQTIEGPNGMGRIETVSVSVNGVPSTGHARGVTQGELLRQEQRAGVIPVSQLSRNRGPGIVVSATAPHLDHHAGDDNDVDDEDEANNDSIPHLRGPDHVGVSDTGPQSSTITGESAVQMHNIDVEAAVGRRSAASGREGSRLDDSDKNDADDDDSSPSTLDNETSSGTKREADLPLETDAPKRAKEAVDGVSTSPPSTATAVDDKMEET
ncbi:hypothetical protein CP533_0890 [Ophiocordyceps camponoti-saundersi (nom. inval.)]|nr:hypothetical protein CP533_0890 [Ophiocordyceps camponoti-saundersi (nom. inval.)]